MSLPDTHKALVVVTRDQPMKVETRPTPKPTPGSAILRVIASSPASYAREIYDGTRPYPFPTPSIPGASAVARVAALGSDATALKVGQLVYFDLTVRARDSPDSAWVLQGSINGPGGAVLGEGEWRDGTWAEYAKVPLENVYPLPENDDKFSVEVERWTYLQRLLVPFGGLRSVNVRAGETVIVAPATGPFGSAGVHAAIGMGAKVIAMGRNQQSLDKLKKAFGEKLIGTVQIVGDVEKETEALKELGPVDVFLDISPPMADQSSHLRSGILALGKGGRVSMMGGVYGNVSVPYGAIMFNDLLLKGKFMCDRADVEMMIRLVRAGLVDLSEKAGVSLIGKYKLEEWDAALTAAAKNAGPGETVLFTP